MKTIADYCRAFAESGQTPIEFARHALAHHRALCCSILDTIGSWPSSEPELRALQLIY